MGGHYGSIQVRGCDREKLCAVLAEIAGSKGKFLVGPLLRGWVGAYPNRGGQNPEIASAIAARLTSDLLYVGVHDDDILFYEFYKQGQLLDSYCSDPDYFGEVPAPERERLKGRPEVFEGILDAAAIADLRTLLANKEHGTFMSERLAELARILGIENAVTSYEYLKDGDRDSITGWKDFVEIPDPKIGAKKKRALRKQVELEWQALRNQGILTASTPLDALTPRPRSTNLDSLLASVPGSTGIVVTDEGRSLVAVAGRIHGLSLVDTKSHAVLRHLAMPPPETDDERFQQWIENNLEDARDRGDDLSVAGLELMRAGGGHPQMDAVRRTLKTNRRNELVFAMELDLDEDRLIVGTAHGLRIYRWSEVVRSSESMPRPLRYASMHYCYDFAIDADRILCGDVKGRLFSLDPDGLRLLVNLPGRFAVHRLQLKSKERRLSVWLHERYDPEKRNQKHESRLVEFDLDRLRAKA
jgi:hypothetical protein